jgi:hypothetical protein
MPDTGRNRIILTNIICIYEFQSPRLVLSREKKLPSESDIEKYAQDNLNIHKKGIFRKKFSVRDMLSWSKVRVISVYLFYVYV